MTVLFPFALIIQIRAMLKHIYKNFIRKLLASQLIGLLVYLYIFTVFLTSRRKFIFQKGFDEEKFQNESAIYVFWHGRMVLTGFMRPKNKKTNIVISDHADGRIIGTIGKLFNANIIWGSSNKNPLSVLKCIFTVLQQKECLAITPDGPRGPAFEINSNIVKIASKANLNIIPFSYGASKKKVFSSWDRFILPLPFGKIAFIYGKPIKIPPHVTNVQVNEINEVIKKELNDISNQSDQLVLA
jgi:lysophospholipid acyltransferase (LPLAT)-like uncharacterized protein